MQLSGGKIFSILSMSGYNGGVSLEMEDLTMEKLTGFKKSTEVLKEVLPKDILV